MWCVAPAIRVSRTTVFAASSRMNLGWPVFWGDHGLDQRRERRWFDRWWTCWLLTDELAVTMGLDIGGIFTVDSRATVFAASSRMNLGWPVFCGDHGLDQRRWFDSWCFVYGLGFAFAASSWMNKFEYLSVAPMWTVIGNYLRNIPR